MAEATTETDILLHGVGAKIICVHIAYMYSLSLFLPPYHLAGNITVGGGGRAVTFKRFIRTKL